MNRVVSPTANRAVVGLLLVCLALVALSGSGPLVLAAPGGTANPAGGLSDPLHGTVLASSGLTVPLPCLAGGQEIAWSGAAGDGAWSSPGNWEGRRVPGPEDIALFVGAASGARVDPAFTGTVGGLVVAAGYEGTLRLDRSLRVLGDLEIAGGTLQGGFSGLDVDGSVRVSGGLLVTPAGAAMNAVSLDIAVPGVVQLGANGKLNLSGGGQPLTGDGLLDTRTYTPNSVEYTAAATADLTAAGPLAGLRGTRPEMFGRVGALALNPGEDGLYAAVVDPAGAYAYFGARNVDPGVVIKVNLSSFTRVGALTLGVNENAIGSAVMDPDGAYAYFATDTWPGRVIKIDLASFTRADAITMNYGENNLGTAVIDPAGEYAYFGTWTSPGYVIKVDLDPFARLSALTLGSTGLLTSAVIDPDGAYAYFGNGGTDPSSVIKVNLANMSHAGTLTLEAGEHTLESAVIDPAGEYAYFSAQAPWGMPCSVVKVDLTTFTRTGALALADVEINPSSAVIDPGGQFAYFGTRTTPGIVVQVDLATFTRTGAVTLNAGESNLRCAVTDPAGQYAYFGTDTAPGIVVKVGLGEGAAGKVYLPLAMRNYR